MSKVWQSWSRKNDFHLDDGHAQDRAFLQALGDYLTGHGHALPLADKRLETALLQGAHSLEPGEFEELVRNVSQLAESGGGGGGGGGETDSAASRLVHKLMAEATPNASERPGEGEKPVIVRHGQRRDPLVTFERSVNVSVGRNVFLTNATRSVRLLCPARGTPKPELSWSKDGHPLQFTERVLWDSAGGLHISEPSVGDVGVYSCTAVNELGFDRESSQLLWAEPPRILVSSGNVTDVESAALKAVVGGRVEARLGANLTLECPITGVPLPTVSWRKEEGALSSSAVPLLDGSLMLHNVSVDDDGTYSCVVSSPLGKALASTVLHVSGPVVGSSLDRPDLSRPVSRRRVLMASRLGTSVTVRPGDVLRIGCPVVPSHRDTVKWFFQNRTLNRAAGLHHRTLVGGRVLEVNTLLGRFDGSYRCQTTAGPRPVTAWVHVRMEEALWRLGDWSPCSSSCALPRPETRPQACSVRDCPPSWVSTVWSKCSTSCGRGSRQRQVSCQRVGAAGVIRALPLSSCSRASRPQDREECQSDTCTGWQASPWPQCSGRCLGPALTVQSRPVACKHLNGSALPESHCDQRDRPLSERNCSSEMCDVQWKVGPWRACTAACGNGFQSRRVECVHRRNSKTLADEHCAWQRRPITWQHCNVTPCGSDCRDTTQYCSVVRQLQLCLVALYKQRCCESCGGAGEPVTGHN
ncbi:hypothetical protein AAFF_G00428710 [Aldrovandia affinis]|uniref:ADAMTS-like protein 1 n=1 Tax=Aldrovandia affinis TaxID=143900 RepID=A0AAD7SBJ8_9TELE|nr:hypothetical protein AAFF_G00428710 [Aldrovandia affinis]